MSSAWEELSKQLEQFDDEILDRLSFEIFCIQMERVLKENEDEASKEPVEKKEAVILPFKRSEE